MFTPALSLKFYVRILLMTTKVTSQIIFDMLLEVNIDVYDTAVKTGKPVQQ